MMLHSKIIWQVIRDNWAQWSLLSVGFVLLYYLAQMLALIIRFGDLPNYFTVFNWFDSVRGIVAATPSWRDCLAIIHEEWLFEAGFMNFDFGMGISVWSLYFAPSKALAVLAMGALIVTNYLLLKTSARSACISTAPRAALAATTGVGASFASLASVTMSWVVCCASPTWVVGLAMMGLGAATSLRIESYGPLVSLFGFSVLIGTAYFAAGVVARAQAEVSQES